MQMSKLCAERRRTSPIYGAQSRSISIYGMCARPDLPSFFTFPVAMLILFNGPVDFLQRSVGDSIASSGNWSLVWHNQARLPRQQLMGRMPAKRQGYCVNSIGRTKDIGSEVFGCRMALNGVDLLAQGSREQDCRLIDNRGVDGIGCREEVGQMITPFSSLSPAPSSACDGPGYTPTQRWW